MSSLPAAALAVAVAALALASPPRPPANSEERARCIRSRREPASASRRRRRCCASDCTGMQEAFTGLLRSTEAATVAQRSWFSRANGAWISGTERFVGCIGTRCGALAFRFRGGFVADLATSTLRGGRTLVVTGGSGGLAGAQGTVIQRLGEDAGYVAAIRLRG